MAIGTATYTANINRGEYHTPGSDTAISARFDTVEIIPLHIAPMDVPNPPENAVYVDMFGRTARLRPVGARPAGHVGPMASGATVTLPDAVIREIEGHYGVTPAVDAPLLDRYETTAQYAALSI